VTVGGSREKAHAMGFKRSPADYISGSARQVAVHDLRYYYGGKSFTGRHFDEFARRSNPDEFNAWDVVAIEMLSVRIPAEAAIHLIEDTIPEASGQIRTLLGRIPADAAIWDETDHLAGKDARMLWHLVKGLHDVGRTKTSKLLAAKRPFLFPIYDQYVGAALLSDQTEDDWGLWRTLFMEEGIGLRELCASVAQDAALPQGISPLRVLDVAIWMREATKGA
jgi:hypothetical protein